MTTKVYKSTSKEDVKALADIVSRIPQENHGTFANLVIYGNLMIPPFWFRGLIKFMCWKKKIDTYTAYEELFKRNPDAATKLVHNVIDHLMNGKDRWFEDSVGGFCQSEIERLQACIYGATGWKEFKGSIDRWPMMITEN